MSVLDQFGGKKKKAENDRPNEMPNPRAPMPERPPPAPRSNYSLLLEEHDHIKAENERLRTGLNAANQHIKELQLISDGERAKKEEYQRFSVRIQTHLEHIARAVTQANKDALEAAAVDPKLAAIADKLEAEIKAIKAPNATDREKPEAASHSDASQNPS